MSPAGEAGVGEKSGDYGDEGGLLGKKEGAYVGYAGGTAVLAADGDIEDYGDGLVGQDCY